MFHTNLTPFKYEGIIDIFKTLRVLLKKNKTLGLLLKFSYLHNHQQF